MGDFSVHEDELYMALLKRRAYLTAFPGTLAPVHGDVAIKAEDDRCSAVLTITRKTTDGGFVPVKLEGASLIKFLNEFFGVENA